ncbi:tetratricopeptide repeat protein [Archangium lansingense]|uniref:Tetratricopeptide repeat protein n=1 Tax=Archangium lansingense TaxID=2995310 RepID=A0ABT4ACN9_9BACT|nr:tetratricopeptide repeat protein [Archangium lansinium]MCY1079101.1 tetratricopeptide repeat protein [Archangium lansinium]
MAHDVFISYASGSPKDKMTADAVCATLERHGLRCWIAPRDILAGEDWGEAIIDALNEARSLVLVFSASANRSQQIKREVERAVHRGIPVIPFRIEDVVPSKALEYFISTPHWMDAMTPPLERHLEHLAHSVRLLLSRPPDNASYLKTPAPREEALEVPSPLPRSTAPPMQARLRQNFRRLQQRLLPPLGRLRGFPQHAWRWISQEKHYRLIGVGVALGVVLLVLGALLLAREPERYPGLAPQAAAHLIRAESFYDARQLGPAMDEYTRAIEIEPRAAPAFAGRALTRIERADFEAAVADASQAIELDPGLAQAYAARGHAWVERREYDKALADAAKSLELEPDNSRAHVVRSRVYLARLEVDRGLEEAKKAVKQDKDSPWAYLARASAHLARQDFDRAREDYDRAIELGPDSALAYIGRARFHLSKDLLPEALADANKAIELGPSVADAFTLRATVWLILQDPERALADANEALRLEPINPEAYSQRALAYSLLNKPLEALEDANEAIRLDDRQAVAFLALAMVHRKAGHLDQAVSDASRAISLDDRLGEAYLLRGLVYATQEHREQALKDLEAGTRLKGARDVEVAQVYATLLIQSQQYSRAISLLNDAVHQHPDNPKLYDTLSTAHLMAGNLGSAELAYRKGLALDPTPEQQFKGAPISEIQPGSQAEQLGLKPGDLILVYDTTLLPTFSQLATLTRQPGTGHRDLKVIRERKVLTFQVEPGPLGVKMASKSERALAM